MSTLNRSRPGTTTTDGIGRRSPSTDHASARRLSPRLSSGAVVAGYLHDISQRHRRSVPRAGQSPAARHPRTPDISADRISQLANIEAEQAASSDRFLESTEVGERASAAAYRRPPGPLM
jgi:hypothetical protein